MRLNEFLKKEKTSMRIGEINHIYENTLGLLVGCVMHTVPYDAKIVKESNLEAGDKVIVYMDKKALKPIQAFSSDGKMFYNLE